MLFFTITIIIIYSEHFYGCKSIAYIKISTSDIAHYDMLNIAHHIK